MNQLSESSLISDNEVKCGNCGAIKKVVVDRIAAKRIKYFKESK